MASHIARTVHTELTVNAKLGVCYKSSRGETARTHLHPSHLQQCPGAGGSGQSSKCPHCQRGICQLSTVWSESSDVSHLAREGTMFMQAVGYRVSLVSSRANDEHKSRSLNAFGCDKHRLVTYLRDPFGTTVAWASGLMVYVSI